MPSSPLIDQRNRVAALSRSRSADDPELLDAKRTLAADVLADHIRRVVDQAPALTDRQINRLSALLNGGGQAA